MMKRPIPTLLALLVLLLIPIKVHAEPADTKPAALFKQPIVKAAVKKPTPKPPTPIFSPVRLDYQPYPYSAMGTYANQYPDTSQCVWGVASMKGNISWSGNASDWDNRAWALGITVSDIPIVGSVAQTDAGGYGHVATVIGVGNSTVTVVEKNFDYNGGVRTYIYPTSHFVYLWL